MSSSVSVSDSSSSSITVAVRIRPLNSRENSINSPVVCSVNPHHAAQVILNPPKSSRSSASRLEVRSFQYDFAYHDQSNAASSSDSPIYQQRVYEDLGTIIVKNAFDGFNASLMAYGQTGAGKSWSMMGASDSGDMAGLIPRISSELFRESETRSSQDASKSFKLECSYIEIYSEKIRDLLNPVKVSVSGGAATKRAELKVREDPVTGPYVEGLTTFAVANFTELLKLIRLGNSERTVAATNMNSESSRSHAIFQIRFTQSERDAATGLSAERKSTINLVDLAGSERAEQTGATGLRLKEASTINKSLTTLGRVISSLAQQSGDKKKPGKDGSTGDVYVSYRDSVLTYLLKESLGGNSKTIMICCVSPAEYSYEETLSTLKYAARAKKIVNKAVVNEDDNAKLIRSLKAEIEALKAKLSDSAKANPATSATPETGDELKRRQAALEAESTEIKAKYEAAMEEKVREMREMMEQSAKMMADREKEWKAKLEDTQKRTAESINQLSASGIELPSASQAAATASDPFLVNLNADPALSESLLYSLHAGRTVIGSRKESANGDERRILLNAVQIDPDHCAFTNEGGRVTIQRLGDSELFVNGEPVNAERQLRHGDRILIGRRHFFRFALPNSAAPASSGPADWDFASQELLSHQSGAQPDASKPSVRSNAASSGHESDDSDESDFDDFDDSYSQPPRFDPRSAEESSEFLDPALAASAESELVPGAPEFRNFSSLPSPLSPLALSASEFDSLLQRQLHSPLVSRPLLKAVRALSAAFQLNSAFFRSIPRRVISLVFYARLKFNFLLLRSRLVAAVQRLALLCDEANAICSALGLPDRFKPVILPFSDTGARLPHHASDIPSSPLYRLFSLRFAESGVIETRNSSARPFHFLYRWNEDEFRDYLGELRSAYAEDAKSLQMREFPHQIACLGHASAYLAPIKAFSSATLKLPVLDAFGELLGILSVQVDMEKVAPGAVKKHEKTDKTVPPGQEVDEWAEALEAEESDDESDHESDDETADDAARPASPSAADSPLFALSVHIVSFDCSALQSFSIGSALPSAGLRSICVQYRIPGEPKCFRTRFLMTQRLEGQEIKFQYSRIHSIPVSAAVSIAEFLDFDALSFDIWANFQRSHTQSKTSRASITALSAAPSSASQSTASRRLSSLAAADSLSMFQESLTAQKARTKTSNAGAPAASPASSLSSSVSLENFLFVDPDLDEESRSAGIFTAASLKFEPDGSVCFRVPMFRAKRLTIAVAQVDSQPFLLESVAKVELRRLSKLKVTQNGASTNEIHSTALPSTEKPFSMTTTVQTAFSDRRLLVCGVLWCREMSEHEYFILATPDGERIRAEFSLLLMLNNSTTPVRIPFSLTFKVYKSKAAPNPPTASSPSVFGSDFAFSDRSARLGHHYRLEKSPQKLDFRAIFHDFERSFAFLARKWRASQWMQARGGKKGRAAAQQITFDALATPFRFGRAARVTEPAIAMEIHELNPFEGLKCGFLLVRDSAPKLAQLNASLSSLQAAAQPRWVVWRPPFLFVFESRGAKKEKSILQLDNTAAQLNELESKDPAIKDSFLVETKTGNAILQAASKDEKVQWIAAIRGNPDKPAK